MWWSFSGLFYGKAQRNIKSEQDIDSAVVRTKKCLRHNSTSLAVTLEDIEFSSNKDEVWNLFKKLNRIMRYFKRLVPQSEKFPLVRDAVEELGVSLKLKVHLRNSGTLDGALIAYKTDVLQVLAAEYRIMKSEDSRDDKLDDELFSQFLPFLQSDEEITATNNNSGRSKKRRKLSKTSFEGKWESNKDKKSNSRSRVKCIYFQSGKCFKGRKCKFKHFCDA